MLKVVHCADLHLERAFSSESLETSAKRKSEEKVSFERLMSFVDEKNVDLVLIAGDLFDKNKVSTSLAEYVFSKIASSGAKFVLSPGNHDFYSPDSVYAKSEIPENMHIFKDSALSSVEYEINGERVRVSGYAFLSHSLEEPPFRGFRPVSDGALNILLAHGNTVSSSLPDCPITAADIRESGFDYIALGHIHNLHEIKREENTYYGYSGSLEPKSLADCGDRGAFYLEMTRNEGRFSISYEFIPMAYRKYSKIEINTTGLSQNEIDEKIKDASKEGFSERDSVRITFEGALSRDIRIPLEICKDCFASVELEIKDRTVVNYMESNLENDPTIRGAVLEILSEKLDSDDERERRIASLAMKYALGALDGADISEYLGDL